MGRLQIWINQSSNCVVFVLNVQLTDLFICYTSLNSALFQADKVNSNSVLLIWRESFYISEFPIKDYRYTLTVLAGLGNIPEMITSARHWNVLIRLTPLFFSIEVGAPRSGYHVRTQQNVARQAKKRALTRTHFVGTLISDSQSPDLRANQLLLFIVT